MPCIWAGFQVLGSVATTMGVVGCTLLAEAQTTSQIPPGEGGVVVEEVSKGSVLEEAGLRPRDVLLAWERLPAPPANPQKAQGTVETVFDWMGLEIEQAPRGTVKLTGQRGGEAKVFEVVPGEWRATVRPRMPEGMLENYARGKELIEAGEIEAGIDLWNKVAGIGDDQVADGRLRCWLLLRIGDAWSKARQWAKAHLAYRSALEAAQDPRSRVAVWRAIGNAYENASEFETAREAHGSAHEIRERTWGESLALSRGLNDLGILDWWQGRLDSSQGHWQRALEIREKLAPGSLDVAMSLNNLGGLAYARGDLDQAAEYHAGALEVRGKLAPDSLEVAASLGNLGVLAQDRGDLDQAAEYYERDLEISQRLAPGSLTVAVSLNNLGTLAAYRSDSDRAADYYERDLEITRALAPGSLNVAATLNNLGLLAHDRGDLDRAAEYYEESLEIEQRMAPGSLAVAASLRNLGRLASDHGDLNRAVEYHEGALEITQKLAPRSLDLAIALYSLGYLASKRGDLDRAAEYFEGSLEIEQRLAPGSSMEAETLHGLATIRRKQNQPQSARTLFLQALQAVENQVARLGGSRDVQAGFRADRLVYYRDTIDLLLELQQPEDAFDILERSRARSFLAQLAERELVFFEIPEELERQRRNINRSYNQTQDEIVQLNPREQKEKIGTLRTQLQQLRWNSEDITERIIEASPKLGALRYPEPLDLDAARQELDLGTVMLSYSVGTDETHVFVLTRDDGLEVKTLLLGEEELRGEIKRVLELQKRRSSPLLYTKALRQTGERLYQALVLPAEELIAKSDRVLIVPDGPLHLLPFALLVRKTGPGEGHEDRDFEYLVEWKPLHSVLSATVYAELKSQRRSQPDEIANVLAFAAFGDPRFSSQRSGNDLGADRSIDVYVRSAAERGFDFRPLPYSREEVNQIAALYPGGAARTFLGAEASEERAKSVGKSARILHFATHGRFDDRIPLNSYLALTTPKEFRKDQDNGLLQAWEIIESVRLDADLVVLSACETGLGDEIDGEGLKGLTRAFQFAGARTVVSSLWQVDDRATAEFMQRFYRHLRAGESKDEALRAGQLELIRGSVQMKNRQGEVEERDLSSPYYWAAFQVIGDWR